MKNRCRTLLTSLAALACLSIPAASPAADATLTQISIQRARVYEGDGFAGWQASVATRGRMLRLVAEGTIWGYEGRNGLLLTAGPRVTVPVGARLRPFAQVMGGLVDSEVSAAAGPVVSAGLGVDVLLARRIAARGQIDLYDITNAGDLGRLSAGLVIGLW